MSDLTYQIKHRTAYQYSGRIDLCHSLLHLTPVEDEHQKVLSHKIDIEPKPEFESTREDYFGNKTHYFSVEHSHDNLEVTSHVEVKKQLVDVQLPVDNTAWDNTTALVQLEHGFETSVPLLNYIQPSKACPSIDALDLFLQPSLKSGKKVMILANEIMARIFNEFTYKPGATQTTTTISEILKNKLGVCQDFAHVMIAALRRLGIPVRYVSGYLETLPPPGQEKLQGSDATHAWVEVYSPNTGWVAFDPTNNKIPSYQHIKICHGRDYFDVQPLRGVFLGSGSQQLSVEVDVSRV